ncbi:hypothetical protein QR680_018717 [Steinernema hermaphroditum]|uniref:Uncharacterized protein n=1 Tax=Steinernema hermaphroditum TaxID=289476 RepID=A0AA39HL52_9BILA|nr:hypothetical protein QR680_018717 [Steinernema hermaphroditum]
MSRIMLGLQVSDEHADLADLSHFELLMKQATEVVQAAKKLQNSQQYKNLFPNGGIYEKVKFGAAILELEDCLNNKDIAVISFYGALPALRNELLQLYGKVAPPSYGYLPERTAVFISHETAIVEVKQASESLASPALSHFDIWMKHAADVVQAAKKLQNSQQYKDLFPNGGAYEKAYVKLGTGILDLEHCLKNKDTAVNSFYAALPALRNELLKLYGMIAPPSYGYLPVDFLL